MVELHCSVDNAHKLLVYGTKIGQNHSS